MFSSLRYTSHRGGPFSMTWFYWSLLATASFALVNIIDKILLLRFAKSTETAMKMLSFFSLIIFFIGALATSIPLEWSTSVWFALAAGFFEIIYIFIQYIF